MTHLIYAVGDIHGDLDQLHTVHGLIEYDFMSSKATSHEIVHIGDLIDRRENSKGTIEYLRTGIDDGKPWKVLKGNHDRLMEWFFVDPHKHDPNLKPDYSWLHHRIGGVETLASYGVKVPDKYQDCLDNILEMARQAVPDSHINFIKNLPLFYDTEYIFFAHAGINLNKPLDKQTEDDLLWIRKNWLDNPKHASKLILHGHTTVDQVTHYGNRINIDTGAAWGNKLSAVVTIHDTVWLLTNQGRTKITQHNK